MKILFVYPPARDMSIPPLGIGYLCSVLRKNGHEPEVLDLTANPLSEEELSGLIDGFGKYDCIGISAIITAYNFVKSFSLKVKLKFHNMPIIVGNAISNACPETLLKASQVNIVVVDEGELTLKELMDNIKSPGNLSNIKGILYKDKDGRIHKTEPRERIKDLDSLPYPAWDLLNIPVYMKNSGLYLDKGIKTGWFSAVRGCPFSCGFCSRPFGQRITCRSANSLINEILEFKKIYGSSHVCMVDDEFMANMSLARDFAKSLLDRKVNITWKANGRVNFVDEGLFKLMKRSGCVTLAYGLESGSQKILDNMNKSATVKQARDAIKITRRAGINMSTPFMFGYIGEDEHTANETADFIKEMKLETTSLFFTTPYPGTSLYDWAKKNNRIKYDEDTYLSLLGNNAEKFLVNLTDMTDEEYLKLKSDVEKRMKRSLPFKIKVDKYFIKKIYYIKARISLYGFNWIIKKIIKKVRGFSKSRK